MSESLLKPPTQDSSTPWASLGPRLKMGRLVPKSPVASRAATPLLMLLAKHIAGEALDPFKLSCLWDEYASISGAPTVAELNRLRRLSEEQLSQFSAEDRKYRQSQKEPSQG